MINSPLKAIARFILALLMSLQVATAAVRAQDAAPAAGETVDINGIQMYFPEEARAIMRKVGEQELTEEEYERQRQIHKHGDAQIRALREQFHGFKDSYDDMNFTGPYLGTITARTLIVHGDRDEFFPVAIPVQMYRSIPNSALWIVPNGGHVPIHDPDVPFAATALRFLFRDRMEEQNSR